MRFQAPRGAEDVLPSESHRWQRLEEAFRRCASLYGYSEIRTPTFEDVQLFLRTAGETSDIVTKQMYDFLDKGGRHIALKAEGTAPAMRAMIEHGLLQTGTTHRIYYCTPVFRYERPQRGRLREHHQVGVELIGAASTSADAEVIEMAVRFYESLGLTGFEVKINSIGRSECRARYRDAILDFVQPWLKDQDEEAKDKARKNPLRLLDSKDEDLQNFLKSAPPILDYLEDESAARFGQLQEALGSAGVRFAVDPSIVRGLDYYTETVFELQISTIGAQSAIGGGGRYDGLIEQLGGPATPSVGFGIGIERALLALDSAGIQWDPTTPEVFVVSASVEQMSAASRLAATLRSKGIRTVVDSDGRSMKSQLKQADRLGCRYAAILGSDELAGNFATLRDLQTSEQRAVGIDDLAAEVGN